MELELRGRIMPASNATFLAELDGCEVVYKPIAGERPLWDFPHGTLADREVAAYLVSEALGWDIVPRTWLGEGPHGPGMVQEWKVVDPEVDAVTLVRAGRTPEGWFSVFDGVDDRDRDVTLVHEDTAELRRMVLFDVLVNNADRKGGHVLAMPDGHRYGVDHGVTFHHEHKLRTVLWGWAGTDLTDDERVVVDAIRASVAGALGERLAPHLTDLEIHALERRAVRLLSVGRLPHPDGGWPAIPWPPF
ncbi:SCO1664 family protein [Nocardioides humilatus]|uniref:SCO1664 family protein n=1 Tax=Nocardioides humilatus TaxID=2607660 RepID=A0A5B1L853_9ACTN|nr:SCO1664 family protein [Nocardioides humilatus]KAA1415867.1 SCO1664 family protein [Nocardioides humilatus]